MKRIWTCIVMIWTIFALCGCSEDDSTYFDLDDSINYLENKYDDKFEYIERCHRSISSYYYGIYVSSEKFPNEKILVEALAQDNDYKVIEYADDYVAIKYKNDVKELFKEMASDVYGDCKVIYYTDFYPTTLPEYMDDSTTLAEYLSDKKSHIGVDIILPPSHSLYTKDAELYFFYEECKKNEVVCVTTVHYASDDNTYKSVNSSADIEEAYLDFTVQGRFWMNDDFSLDRDDFVWDIG